jgi:hypothetical protein
VLEPNGKQVRPSIPQELLVLEEGILRPAARCFCDGNGLFPSDLFRELKESQEFDLLGATRESLSTDPLSLG